MKSGFQKVIASLLIAIIMISTTSITVDSAATVGDIKCTLWIRYSKASSVSFGKGV